MTIATRELTYDVDGLTMVAHLASPDGEGPWPAVLIAHDGVGLDDYQRQRADALAAHGHVALAMDYHGGQTFFGRPDAMLARTMPLLGDVERMQDVGRAAVDILFCLQEVVHTPGTTCEWLDYRDGGHALPQRANLSSGVSEALPERFGLFCPAVRGPLWDGDVEVPSQFGLAIFSIVGSPSWSRSRRAINLMLLQARHCV